MGDHVVRLRDINTVLRALSGETHRAFTADRAIWQTLNARTFLPCLHERHLQNVVQGRGWALL